MPANLLDHALSKARVHRSGSIALLVIDGNGQLACAWSELMTAMRWAVTKPARPRAEACLDLVLERLSLWIVSTQCSLAPKGAAAHQWQLLGELKSSGLGDGASWRVQKPEAPAQTQQPAASPSAPTSRSAPNPETEVRRRLDSAPGRNPAPRVRNYTSPQQLQSTDINDHSPPSPAAQSGSRLERQLRGDCRGRVIEESRNGGLHIELSGD